jgi:hypothetical protein
MMKDLSDLLRKINTLKKLVDDFSPTLFQSVTVITPESTLRFMGESCASLPPHLNFAFKWLDLGDSKRSVSANTYSNAKPELRQSKFNLERQSSVDDWREC